MALSLKWHIQRWYASVLLLVLVTLGVGFYYYEKARRIDAVDEQLVRFVPMLLGPDHLRGGPRKRPPSPDARIEMQGDPSIPAGWEKRDPGSAFSMPEVRNLLRNRRGSRFDYFNETFTPLGFYARMEFTRIDREGFVSDGFPEIEMPVALGAGQLSRTRDGRFREFFHEIPASRFLIGYDLTMLSSGLNRLKLQIAGILLGVFAITMVIGHFLIVRSIRPLRGIRQTTKAIASAQLDARVPEPRPSDVEELQTLGTDLNHAFAQLESLFSRQTRFTADASHELRTPLTALLAQLDRGLRHPHEKDDYLRILETSRRSARRIRRITEQLLELARYDSGSITMDFEDVSLRTMLHSLAEELEPYVMERGSRLIVDLEDGELHCDPFRLEQVLTNFINNALQHNPEPVAITLRSRVEEDSICLEVEDDGKGIAPENIDKLFDRFFQEDRSRTQRNKTPNVGLGLSIAQAIVHAHDGSITVTSERGKVTTFTVRIPRSR